MTPAHQRLLDILLARAYIQAANYLFDIAVWMEANDYDYDRYLQLASDRERIAHHIWHGRLTFTIVITEHTHPSILF